MLDVLLRVAVPARIEYAIPSDTEDCAGVWSEKITWKLLLHGRSENHVDIMFIFNICSGHDET